MEKVTTTTTTEAPGSMTLSDFMGWGSDQEDSTLKKDPSDELCKDEDTKQQKLANVVTSKKVSYLENLGATRSPTARH